MVERKAVTAFGKQRTLTDCFELNQLCIPEMNLMDMVYHPQYIARFNLLFYCGLLCLFLRTSLTSIWATIASENELESATSFSAM